MNLKAIADKTLSFFKAPIRYIGGATGFPSLYVPLKGATETYTQKMYDRQEMYSDRFVGNIVSVFVGRAMGAMDNSTSPFFIRWKDSEAIPKSVLEMTNEEFEHLEGLASSVIYSMTEDGEGLGNGYCKIDKEEGKGVTSLIYNWSTKPFHLTPIMDSWTAKIVSYRAMADIYLSIDDVGHVNATSTGASMPTSSIDLENHNVWVKKESTTERYYDDYTYGGALEGLLPKYNKYRWAMESLFNSRVASSVIYQYLTHNLDNLNKEEAAALAKNFTDQVKEQGNQLRKKQQSLDPTANVLSMYIPTFGKNNKNSVGIETHNPQFNLSTEDALLHIKDFIGAIGYHLQFTPFGDNNQTGKEEDVYIESKSANIRRGVTSFALHLTDVHFRYKFKQQIDLSKLEIVFSKIVNRNKLTEESMRLDALSNSQSLVGLIESVKELGIKNTVVLRSIFKDVLKEKDRDEVLSEIVSELQKKEDETVEEETVEDES